MTGCEVKFHSKLVTEGRIECNRVYSESKGASQPVADNRTAEDRAKDRRARVESVGTRSGP